MVDKLCEGGIYWTILNDCESDNYDAGFGPREPNTPWQGKFSTHQRPGGLYMCLNRFNKETGEIDDDSNATATVNSREGLVFYTEIQAWLAYIKAMRVYMSELSKQIERAGESILKAGQRINEL